MPIFLSQITSIDSDEQQDEPTINIDAIALADEAERAHLSGEATDAAPSTYDLIAHLTRQRVFSLSTFGPGTRTKGVVHHIKKELREIEQKPADLEEWIDVMMLACDGAWRTGAQPEQIATAFEAKLGKNENREWPDWRTADPDKAIEHVRTAAAPSSAEARVAQWIEAALKRYPLNWAFDATNPALIIDNIISGATAEACNRTGEVESLFSVTMKEIHDEAEGALGYPQVCDAPTAVRRLALRVKELEAQIRNFKFLNDEMNGRSGDLLEAYEEVIEGNRALSQKAEQAEAQREPEREGGEAGYHDRIMNISAPPAQLRQDRKYTTGHRDARHAAAEIALEADDRIRALEAQVQNFKFLNDEMGGRLGDLLEAYEEVVLGNHALSKSVETAEAQLAEYNHALATLGIQRDVLGYISGLKMSCDMALEAAEAREAKMRAILEGAGYDDLDSLDDTLTRDIEDCRRVGETVGNIVENHIAFAGKASERAEAAEAQLAEAKKVAAAAVEYDRAKTAYNVDEAYGMLSVSVVEQVLNAHGKLRTVAREYAALSHEREEGAK